MNKQKQETKKVEIEKRIVVEKEQKEGLASLIGGLTRNCEGF